MLRAARFPQLRQHGNFPPRRHRIFRRHVSILIAQYLDKSDYLFTISLAHILLARDRRNLFGVLFLSNEYGSRTVPQIISSPWNREAIDCTAVQYGLTVKEAEAVYRDVRFYTFGIAEALYAGSLIAEEDELRQLLRGAIRKFCAK